MPASPKKYLTLATTIAVCGALERDARAECPSTNFDNYAVNTAITNQIPGVTFSVTPQTCPSTIHMRVVEPTGGTSSGTKALRISTGCPDFSDEWVRMVFAQAQSEVQFTLGDGAHNVTIRMFSTTSGGVPFSTRVVATTAGVHRFVRLTSATANIRRIELQASTSGFEAIDDLKFNIDTTPPEVEFTSPPFGACVCDTIAIEGTACEDNGIYGNDKLEHRSVNSDGPWTQTAQYFSEVCTENTLYVWDASDPAITEGHYYLRSTATNACGLSDTDIATVYVSKSFSLSEGSFRSPEDGLLIGGHACFDGSITESCFSHYTVDYRPASGGPWIPVDGAHATYTAQVVNDPFAFWDTTGLPDGDYVVRVTGEDQCGNTASITRDFSLDNTSPIGVITEPMNCDFVDGLVTFRGTAFDLNLSSWVLEYFDNASQAWIAINTGMMNVNDGILGVWDTDLVPPCAYAVRLRVSDKAMVGNGACDYNSHVAMYQLALNVGPYCPTP